MSWTNPPTWSVGQLPAAANLNILSDDLSYLYATPLCHLTHSADQAANPTAVLTWDTERQDTDGMHSTSSNPTRITIQTPGYYLINVNVAWEVNATGLRSVEVLLNATTTIAIARQAAVTTALERTEHELTTLRYLAAGYYIEVVCYQTSGGTLDIEKRADYSPEFTCVWLRS